MTSCFDDLAGNVLEKSQSKDLDLVSGGDKPDLEARESQDQSRPDCSAAAVVWDGWLGALIRQGFIKSSKLGKRRRLSDDEAFQAGVWSAGFKDGKASDKAKQIAWALARFVGDAMFGIYWCDDIVPAQVCSVARSSVFRSFARFALSIFDLEDFERLYNVENDCHSLPEFFSKLKQVESGSGPLVAIAEGRIDFTEFSDLWEHDVGEILQYYEYRVAGPFPEVFSWRSEFWGGLRNSVTSDCVDLALKEMECYVPIMEEYKMELILELMYNKGFRVLDALIIEAWKDIDLLPIISSLHTALAADKQSDDYRNLEDFAWSWVMSPSEFVDDTSLFVVSTVRSGLFQLAFCKQSALQKFQDATISPIDRVDIKGFADEVLEVVKIANHRRRMEGAHFISVHHILFGLTLSRVGDIIKRMLPDAERDNFAGNPSKFPLYYVYRKSGDVARDCGDKVVRLEHYALAIVGWIQGNNHLSEEMAMDECPSAVNDNDTGDDELYEALKNADTECSVKSSRIEDLVNPALKECFPELCLYEKGNAKYLDVPSMRELLKAFESGLELPVIRASL